MRKPWPSSFKDDGFATSRSSGMKMVREREREAETKGWGEKWCVVYNISLTTYIFTNG